jgi:hypothetical protein
MTKGSHNEDPEGITQLRPGSAATAAQPQESLSSPSSARGRASTQSLPSLLRAGAVAPACRELRAPSGATPNYFPPNIGPVLEPVFSAEGMPQRSASDAARPRKEPRSRCEAFSGAISRALWHPFRMPPILNRDPGLRRVCGLPWAKLGDPFRIIFCVLRLCSETTVNPLKQVPLRPTPAHLQL